MRGTTYTIVCVDCGKKETFFCPGYHLRIQSVCSNCMDRIQRRLNNVCCLCAVVYLAFFVGIFLPVSCIPVYYGVWMIVSVVALRKLDDALDDLKLKGP